MQVTTFTPPPSQAGAPQDRDALLRHTAQRMEAQFLSEMLKHAGLGQTDSEFSGGVGEAQFGSFLREQQAEQMSRAGGIGLAESIFQALKEREQ